MVGSSLQLGMELFLLRTGTKMVHVPYKGSAPMVSDLIGGQVESSMDAATTSLPHVKSGKLRALGVSTTQRMPMLPDVPTIDEAGVKGYDMSFWFAAYVPAGTPPAVVTRLNELLVAATRSAPARAYYESSGVEAWSSTSDELARFQAADTLKWGKVIKSAGIEPE